MRACCLVLLAVVGWAELAFGDQAAKIDALVEPLIEAEALVGCVVGVVEDGRQDVYSYGLIRRGDEERPDGKTVYEIGSITKAFTGTLLADMVERGVVKLDAPVQNFVPTGIKVPSKGDQTLTLLLLANHTSGLPRMPDNMKPADAKNPYADYTAKQMYAFLNDHQLRRAPGEYEYSNYAMGLLGQMLADKAGKSYEELVVERICAPLDMDDTCIALGKEQQDRLAPPHNGQGDVEHNWDFQAFAGAGAVRSTADDMLKFISATLRDDDSEFSKAGRRAWEKTHGNPGEIGVGLGWHIARDGETRWHNGQTGGYSSAMFIYPPKKLGVVVLTNTASDQTTPLAEKIVQSLLGIEPEPIAVRKAIELDSALLKSYVGTYALAPFFSITVTFDDGKLMAQATGQDKFQVFPSAEDEFFYKVVDAQLSFVKDEKQGGKVTKMILHQNGRDLPGNKVELGARGK